MKKKTYKKLQKSIQDTYILMFFTWTFAMVVFKKYASWYELRYVLAVVIITGILTILKAKTFLSKKSNRKWLVKEIAKDLKSEKGIRF